MEAKPTSVKDKIKVATAKLLNEKSYIDITVTDIANAANVARVSFYRNYNSVAEVFDDIVDDIFNEMVSKILPVLKCNDDEKWRELLYTMFYRFPKHHSVGNIKPPENINAIFSNLFEKSLSIQNSSDLKTISDKYMPFGKIGLIVNIIKQWMLEGKKEPAEEMVEFIMTFITKF